VVYTTHSLLHLLRSVARHRRVPRETRSAGTWPSADAPEEGIGRASVPSSGAGVVISGFGVVIGVFGARGVGVDVLLRQWTTFLRAST
jgi:hypothetical protein